MAVSLFSSAIAYSSGAVSPRIINRRQRSNRMNSAIRACRPYDGAGSVSIRSIRSKYGGPMTMRRFKARRQVALSATAASDTDAWNAAAKEGRLMHLEQQAMDALKKAVEASERPVFPCALIAGDVVILELLNKLGYLKSGRVKVMFVDTFHLFPETITFLAEKETAYNFKAEMFKALTGADESAQCEDKAEYDRIYGADLWKENIDEYDRVCKVEPFQRGLKTLQSDMMINGRRRDHGAERAFLDLFESGTMGKVQPLAYWTFEDCFDYLERHSIPAHPLHAEGYPSLGDAKDTVKVDRSKWFEYAGERSGRFVGLKNKDGSTKTECGIHVDGAEKTWDRDLWAADASSKVKQLDGPEGVADVKAQGVDGLLVVYAPWCQFCQAMEEEYETLAAEVAGDNSKVVAKLRGDEIREFVSSELQTESFPTILRFAADGSAPVKYTGTEEQRTSVDLAEFLATGKVPAAVSA